MKNRKVLIIAMLVFILAVSAVWAGGQQESKGRSIGDEIVIGWAPPDITGVFKTATDYLEKGAADARKAGLNVKVTTRAAAEHTSAIAQVDAINNMIVNNVDVIICSPSDVEALKPVLKEAVDNGIPVILVNLLTPIEGSGISSYIGFDNFQAAQVAAYAMLDALGGPGVQGPGETVKVAEGAYLDLAWWEKLYEDVDKTAISGKLAIIEGIAGTFFSNARVDGFHSVIDDFSNIEVVTTLPADWNRQKGIKAAENILQTHTDLDGIWSASNEMGIGSFIAAKNADREKDLILITNDGTPESVDMIRAGELQAEVWHGFPDWGWYGAKFAVMLALGLDVPKTFDIRPRVEYKANADSFYPNPKLEPINWQSIIEAAF